MDVKRDLGSLVACGRQSFSDEDNLEDFGTTLSPSYFQYMGSKVNRHVVVAILRMLSELLVLSIKPSNG